MANNSILVQDETANEFISTMSLNTARRAHLGDPEAFSGNPAVATAVDSANEALADGIDLIKRLAKDETKLMPVEHEAGERVANQVAAVLNDTKSKLENMAEAMFDEGAALVGRNLRLDADNAFRDDRLHSWIEREAATPEGLIEIREAAVSDRDVASVLWTSKPFLLGLNDVVLGNLKMDAVKAHVPKAQIMFDDARTLQTTAARYPQIIRSVKASFFNRAMADRAAATRVDI